MEDTCVIEHWHGFQTARNIVRTHEITVSDLESDLSAHVVTVPARSLGGEDYLYRGRDEPFEWSSLSTDSLGNTLTARGHGEAGYMYYEETQVPLLTIAIPSDMVICGSADGMVRALASGLRDRLATFVKGKSAERQDSDRDP